MIAELRELIGEHIRTDDPTRFNCGALKSTGWCQHDECGLWDSFGAEGVLVGVDEFEDGRIWLNLDWGYSILYQPTTRISIRTF